MTTYRIPALLRDLLTLPHAHAQRTAATILKHYGYRRARLQRGHHYVYGKGNIPLCLVAHTDTVCAVPPACLSVSRRGIIRGQDGLGADDRAGVYAIAALLQRGFRPHVLFTDLEECGGLGAQDAVATLAPPAVHALVQLDRRGANDAVYYSHNPAGDWEDYITSHGFQTANGSFTDISTLMPSWGLGGVNLSVGYAEEHRPTENLSLPNLNRTINAVAKMLSTPPVQRIDYVKAEMRWHAYWRQDWPIWDNTARSWTCRKCGEPTTSMWDDLCPDCERLLLFR